MFKIIPNNAIDYGKVAMTCDKNLANDIPDPLPEQSGFLMLVVGSSGSGKTSFVINLISKKNKRGKGRQSLIHCFNKIIVCSPSLKTLKEDVFKDLDDEQKYQDFDDCMNDIYDHMMESEAKSNLDHEEDQTNLLIIDDCATQLKQNRQRELKLVSLLQNRRHLGGGGLSCILISQKYNMIPTGIRSNLSHLVLYRCKTLQEEDTIVNEVLPIEKKVSRQLFDFVFEKKFCFLFVDMTLSKSNKLRFFKCFDQINI